MDNNSIRKQLELVREAYDHAMRAQGLYNDYRRAAGAHGTATPELPFTPIIIALTHTAEDVSRRIEERRRRFDSVPVLQASLRFKDGTTKRVAVNKPTDETDEPHIGELFYKSLSERGVVASLESYPVLVVDRYRRVVAEIPAASETENQK